MSAIAKEETSDRDEKNRGKIYSSYEHQHDLCKCWLHWITVKTKHWQKRSITRLHVLKWILDGILMNCRLWATKMLLIKSSACVISDLFQSENILKFDWNDLISAIVCSVCTVHSAWGIHHFGQYAWDDTILKCAQQHCKVAPFFRSLSFHFHNLFNKR